MEKFSFITSEKIRIDEFLRQELPSALTKLKPEIDPSSFSNSKLRRLILAGAVFVNGKEIRRPAFELRGRSQLVVQFDSQKFFFEKQPDDIDFIMSDKDVLFEDDDLIFVNKPAFLPVEQTITGNRKNLHDAVVDYLWKRSAQQGKELRNPPYVGIMHRLDRETSGVILFTKNRSINKAVHDLFENHEFTKKYLALSCYSGRECSKSFCVEKSIGRISAKSQAAKWGSLPESRGGLYSKTDFTVLRPLMIDGKKCLEIECSLYTGRTHQIRVHLSEAGLPILGDELYGGKPYKRIMLHSRLLEMELNGKKLSVRAPVPW